MLDIRNVQRVSPFEQELRRSWREHSPGSTNRPALNGRFLGLACLRRTWLWCRCYRPELRSCKKSIFCETASALSLPLASLLSSLASSSYPSVHIVPFQHDALFAVLRLRRGGASDRSLTVYWGDLPEIRRSVEGHGVTRGFFVSQWQPRDHGCSK